MTIPGDPQNRWWMETSAQNPTRVEEFRSALLAFMAFGPGREPKLAGSGFIVDGSPDLALVITAKHVLTEGIGRVQQPWSRHVPTALFVNSDAPPLSLDPQKLKLVWMGSQHADMMNVGHVGYNDSLDAACCIITPQDTHGLHFKPTAIPLDTTVPNVGDIIHMVSLDGMTVTEQVPPTDPSGKGHMISITRRVSVRIGVVTGVHPSGLRHYRWPCFTTSIPVEPGMSGGFVILPREGETIAACGIVCADNSPDGAKTNFLQCGESIITCAWPALALHVPESIPADPKTPVLTIYQMMREGRMLSAAGGLDRVDIVEQENGGRTVQLIRYNRSPVSLGLSLQSLRFR